jgi:hypothetical protein
LFSIGNHERRVGYGFGTAKNNKPRIQADRAGVTFGQCKMDMLSTLRIGDLMTLEDAAENHFYLTRVWSVSWSCKPTNYWGRFHEMNNVFGIADIFIHGRRRIRLAKGTVFVHPKCKDFEWSERGMGSKETCCWCFNLNKRSLGPATRTFISCHQATGGTALVIGSNLSLLK